MKAMAARRGMEGVISADRIFGLLEREFDTQDIEASVAKTLRTSSNVDLDLTAHRTLLNLATTAEGKVRLVTTNFDRLFEACNDSLPAWIPPRFPDVARPDQFDGIVHLHGSVNEASDAADGDGFVLSSAEFGRAYLAEGWATEFVKAILERYIVVFVGYAAEDPPVQHLLEALNKRPGQSNGLFAFQSGEPEEAFQRWFHKGVNAIAYSEENGHEALWRTLEAWAVRAKAPDEWIKSIVETARYGPEQLEPYQRGQVAHVVSTAEGARVFAASDPPPPADWLMVLDANRRYGETGNIAEWDEPETIVDPFDLYGLDTDQKPKKKDPDDLNTKREVPSAAWDAFDANSLDHIEVRDLRHVTIRGFWATRPLPLPSRLDQLCQWIAKIAQEPATIWWAAGQHGLQENLIHNISGYLRDPALLTRPVIGKAWRYLFEAWEEQFRNRDHELYKLQNLIGKAGWDLATVRYFAALLRAYLYVRIPFLPKPKPPTWQENLPLRDLISVDVKYPTIPNISNIPNEWLALVSRKLRENLECALELEGELDGYGPNMLSPIVADETRDDRHHRSHGLSGAVMNFVNHFERLVGLDAVQARREMALWPSDDTIFARLRIWAGRFSEVVPREAFGEHIARLSDEAFWDHYHKRDLLLVLAARWPKLSADTQMTIEQRLLRGSPRREKESDDDFENRKAWNSLTYITWLSHSGCVFSAELNSAIENLRSRTPDWQAKYAEKAANSVTVGVRSVKTDAEYSSLLHEPLSNLIAKAAEISGRSDDFLIEKDPLLGLAREKPVRTLAALTNAAKRNEYLASAWRTLMRLDARGKDEDRQSFSNKRFAMLIAERLIRLPDDTLAEILGSATDWFASVSGSLASRYSETFDRSVSRFCDIISKDQTSGGSRVSRSSRDPDWVTHAINSPTGKLAEALLEDPKTVGLKAGQGFPSDWINYVNELLKLPNDVRPYALVIFAHNLVWFYEIDPAWVDEKLLSELDSGDTNSQQAVLSGFFWGHRSAQKTLFYRLKPHLLCVATEKTPFAKENREEAAAHLLIGWGTKDDQTGQRYVTDIEFREALLKSDESFRTWVLSHFERWVCDEERTWQELLGDFLRNVWPRQKAVKS